MPDAVSSTPAAAAERKPLSAPQKAMRKLGLVRAIDLALHLPLRYEDETRIVRLADAREGETVQIEGTVTASEVSPAPMVDVPVPTAKVTVAPGTPLPKASTTRTTGTVATAVLAVAACESADVAATCTSAAGPAVPTTAMKSHGRQCLRSLEPRPEMNM